MSKDTKQTLPDLSPEISLLLACGRTQVNEEVTDRIRKLAQGSLDWNSLIKTSLAHGLMPLLYENLKAKASDLVPQAHLDRLKDFYERNAARNIFLTGELIKILGLFESEGLAG